jgi:hypothetical protein
MGLYCRIHIDLDKNQSFKPEFKDGLVDTLLILAARYQKEGLECFRILDKNGSHCGMFEIVRKETKK